MERAEGGLKPLTAKSLLLMAYGAIWAMNILSTGTFEMILQVVAIWSCTTWRPAQPYGRGTLPVRSEPSRGLLDLWNFPAERAPGGRLAVESILIQEPFCFHIGPTPLMQAGQVCLRMLEFLRRRRWAGRTKNHRC